MRRLTICFLIATSQSVACPLHPGIHHTTQSPVSFCSRADKPKSAPGDSSAHRSASMNWVQRCNSPQASRHPFGSRQHLMDQLAVDIGEAEVAALELERELLVLDPKQVKNGRVDVVDMTAV